MVLIKCEECNHSISSKAEACIKCGAPIKANKKAKENIKVENSDPFSNYNATQKREEKSLKEIVDRSTPGFEKREAEKNLVWYESVSQKFLSDIVPWFIFCLLVNIISIEIWRSYFPDAKFLNFKVWGGQAFVFLILICSSSFRM